jgi:hypothetical protein
MPAEITGDLQVQNENLLQIIHQMREDMEDLTKQLSQRTAVSNTGVPITEGNRELLSRRRICQHGHQPRGDWIKNCVCVMTKCHRQCKHETKLLIPSRYSSVCDSFQIMSLVWKKKFVKSKPETVS